MSPENYGHAPPRIAAVHRVVRYEHSRDWNGGSPTVQKRRSKKLLGLKCSWLLLLLLSLLTLPLEARTWRDATGRFEVEGDFVSANDELVVVRAADRLLAFELKELSKADRDYVGKMLAEKPARTLADPASVDASPIVKSDSTVAPKDDPSDPATDASTSVGKEADVTRKRTWELNVPDLSIDGEFFGFSFEPLIITQRGSQIIVGKTPARELPEFYRTIVPLTVASIEGVVIPDLRSLTRWVQRNGAPLEYEVESLVIEHEKLGRVTIPLFLLAPSAKSRIEQPYERWKLANSSNDSSEIKDRYYSRERFLTRTELAEQLAAAQVRRQVQLLRLEQLAANTNVTELWEVVLLPPGYGFPISVIIPGRTSAEAQQVALAQYPGFTLSGISKATF